MNNRNSGNRRLARRLDESKEAVVTAAGLETSSKFIRDTRADGSAGKSGESSGSTDRTGGLDLWRWLLWSTSSLTGLPESASPRKKPRTWLWSSAWAMNLEEPETNPEWTPRQRVRGWLPNLRLRGR